MNNTMVRAIAFALLIGFGAQGQAVPKADVDMAPADKALNQLYWSGHEALKKSDWAGALEQFARLEKELKTKEPKNADAAVYWQAYAQAMAKREDAARRLVQRLHEEFPQSRWSAEADELLTRKATAGNTDPSAGVDEDLVETAVEGLMNAPPERALPLLKKVLQGHHSDKIKKRALFVLSQLDMDAALDVVVDVAKSSDDADLRSEAIRMLGVSGEDKALARLGELYKGARNSQEKLDVLQAWMVADRKDLIYTAAREESDPDVQRRAIQQLGALDATDELKQLSKQVKNPALQQEIIRALGVADATDALIAIAQSDQPEAVRIEALQAIGISGSDEASAALVDMYPKMGTSGLRDAVLHGLLVAGDSEAMTRLYRAVKSKEEKRAILRILTTMGDDSALDVIEEELK